MTSISKHGFKNSIHGGRCFGKRLPFFLLTFISTSRVFVLRCTRCSAVCCSIAQRCARATLRGVSLGHTHSIQRSAFAMYLLQNETIVDGLALYFMTEVRSRIELYGASAVLSCRRVHIGMIFRILSRTHRHTATSIHHIDYVQQRLCIYFSVMTSSVHVAPQRHGPFCTDVRMCVCLCVCG